MRIIKKILYTIIALLPLAYVVITIPSYIGNDTHTAPPVLGSVQLDPSGDFFVITRNSVAEALLKPVLPTAPEATYDQFVPYSGVPFFTVSTAITETNSIKYTVPAGYGTTRPNSLAGRWFTLNGITFYVGSNSTTSMAAYTDHTKTAQQVISSAAVGDIIYPASLNSLPAASRDTYTIKDQGAYWGGFTLTVKTASTSSNTVTYQIAPDSVLSAIGTMELRGHWCMIGGRVGYVGSNSTSTMAIYTDETQSRELDITTAAGDRIFIGYMEPVVPEVVGIQGAVVDVTLGFFEMLDGVGIPTNFYTVSAYCILFYYFIVTLIILIVELLSFVPSKLTRWLEV